MGRAARDDKKLAELDELIEKITVDAYGDDEQLSAFQYAFEEDVTLPADGFVIGEPVSVSEINYDGNERRGLTATCRRENGSEHVVAASDVVFPQGSRGARHIAAYRKWLGLDPYPPESSGTGRSKRRHKATADDLDLSAPIELIGLSVKERAARCRLLGSDRTITLRATRLWDVVPGEVITVKPRKQWSYAGHPYLSGEIDSTRLDVPALGLVPLRLADMGTWDPKEHYWGEANEPIEEWAKPIIARGPRPEFKMEQVLPGQDPDDPLADPIGESNDLKDAGEGAKAHKILMELCQADLRCLDAHAHLGNFVFEHLPKEAIRHYEVGLRIGELSLGEGFDGVLLWGHIDNRPFLRCMHGYGLCLWRLGRYDEAGHVFEKMLWLNPSDNQGARFLVEEVRAGKTWEENRDERRSMRGRRMRKVTMSLRTLKDTPPWDWPEGTGNILLDILRDDRSSESDLLLATELAGDFTVISDELVDALLSILQSGDKSEGVRGRAAISLGPVLEYADTEGFEDAGDLPITERTFHRIQQSLRRLYVDADVPKGVRRRILEASVRAPQDWHDDAVRAGNASDDKDWRLTAVFCMQFVRGFDEQILEALESTNPDIHCDAVVAAGNWHIDAAWPHVAALVASRQTDKPLLLAAIEAVASIRPHETAQILDDLADSDDEDIVAAVHEAIGEAIAMVEDPLCEDEDEELDEDDDSLH